MARARRWVFTLNNPETDVEADHESGTGIVPDWSRWNQVHYAICQLERGENGTIHLQGYVRFGAPTRLGGVREILPRAHWEVAKGNEQQCVAYCSKQETRLHGPWKYGERSEQGKRNDLQQVKELLDEGASEAEVADAHFGSWCRYRESFQAYKRLREERRCWLTELIVLAGPTGTGKSTLANELSGGNAYYKDATKWWDGYQGQRVVVMDDFVGNMQFTELLRLADKFPHQVEVKGGIRNFTSKCIIITSNKTPEEWYDNTSNCIGALYRRITHFVWMDGENSWETKKYKQDD